MKDEAQELKRKQIESKKTDPERWKWLLNNQARGFVVLLDNDETYIDDETDEEREWSCVSFDNSIGDMPGVIDLLNVIGIKCERV